ncbi:MAG: bifunctional nuclease domain-containing protein [Candidatus Aenigmatarchaeota archaeon]
MRAESSAFVHKPAKNRGVRSGNGRTKIIFIALAISAVLIFAASATLQYFSADGFVEASVLQVSGDTIIIGNNCTAIAATTSPERAQSILQGIDGATGERPNTHDTIAQILKSFNITADAVKFNYYDGRYFYSDMILRSGSKVLALDMMPSDAIAIALRANATIYINGTLLAQIGKKIC